VTIAEDRIKQLELQLAEKQQKFEQNELQFKQLASENEEVRQELKNYAENSGKLR